MPARPVAQRDLCAPLRPGRGTCFPLSFLPGAFPPPSSRIRGGIPLPLSSGHGFSRAANRRQTKTSPNSLLPLSSGHDFSRAAKRPLKQELPKLSLPPLVPPARRRREQREGSAFPFPFCRVPFPRRHPDSAEGSPFRFRQGMASAVPQNAAPIQISPNSFSPRLFRAFPRFPRHSSLATALSNRPGRHFPPTSPNEAREPRCDTGCKPCHVSDRLTVNGLSCCMRWRSG